jgi:outer membrane protein TolC
MILTALGGTVWAAFGPGSVPVPDEPSGPESRIRAVARASWAGPDFESAMAALDAAAESARVEAHPGAPYTELQREGISQFYKEAANATWYLRVGSPFNAPWFTRAIHDSLAANDRYVAAARRVAALEASGRAVEAWLELAAADERLVVCKTQLRRLERALDLQRERLELGEASGAEVTQLRLERLRLIGVVNEHRARQALALQALERWAGPDAPPPRAGDLTRLYAGFRPVDPAPDDSGSWIESSPGMLASSLNVEWIRLDGERARQTVWGPPEAEISWERVPSVETAEGFDAFGVRLRFPLPVGGLGKRQAAVSAARQQQARADHESARRELGARIQTEIERSRAADEVLAGLDDHQAELTALEHSLDERFRLGAMAYLEYVDGLARLDEVRMQIIDAQLAGSQARLVLAVLTGDPELFPLPEYPVDSRSDEEDGS